MLKDNSRFKASKRDNNNRKTTVTTRSAVSELFPSSNLDCNLKQKSIFPKTKQNESGVHFKYHLNHQFRNPSQTNHEWEHQFRSSHCCLRADLSIQKTPPNSPIQSCITFIYIHVIASLLLIRFDQLGVCESIFLSTTTTCDVLHTLERDIQKEGAKC
jgi:hypothetical protein